MCGTQEHLNYYVMNKPNQRPPVVLLSIGIAFFLFALTQLKDARKTYLQVDDEYRFDMTLFVIFISLSFLFFGIYIGIWWYKSQGSQSLPKPQTKKN